MTDHAALLRRAVSLEGVTVGYDALEGIGAIGAGLAGGSVALTGFGFDSVIEVTSGVLRRWRLRAELGSPPLGLTVEARAAPGAGLLLLLLAGYLMVESGRRLVTGDRPEESMIGIALMVLSLVVMPLLARSSGRRRPWAAGPCGQTRTKRSCAWLSLTTLLGLVLNSLLRWWWADPLAALAMLPLIVREGLEAVKGMHRDERETGPPM